MLERPELKSRVRLAVDATGVGDAVIDQMREAGLAPVPVIITAGQRTRRVNGAWRVPKRILVAGLVTALENGRLRLAKGMAYSEALVRELQAFRVTITSPRHATYGGAGEHDDLVVAVALAAWWPELLKADDGDCVVAR